MTTSHKAPKVLVVEDDPNHAENVRRILTGFECDVAKTLEEAKLKLAADTYQAIIADLTLGKKQPSPHVLTALTALAETICQDEFCPPIIVLTGHVADRNELCTVINSYSGKIWGWHEKGLLSPPDFVKNVKQAIDGRRKIGVQHINVETLTIRQIIDSLTPKQMYSILIILITLLTGAGVIGYRIATIMNVVNISP